MPITQERFMIIITGAKRLINLQHALKDAMTHNIAQDISIVNAAIVNTTDANAKHAIQLLTTRMQLIHDVFLELKDTETDKLIGIILAEEIHFKKANRKNTKARYYQTQARRDQGIMPRAPEVELERPHIIDRTPTPTIANIDNDKGFQDFQKWSREKYWPDATQAPPTPPIAPINETNTIGNQAAIATKIAQERKENEKRFGQLDLDTAASNELELMRLAKLGLRPTSYDPKVTATSAPTQDELNEPPTRSGEDLL